MRRPIKRNAIKCPRCKRNVPLDQISVQVALSDEHPDTVERSCPRCKKLVARKDLR